MPSFAGKTLQREEEWNHPEREHWIMVEVRVYTAHDEVDLAAVLLQLGAAVSVQLRREGWE